jgi:anthranilate phosphoribosyltransferase
MRAVLEDLIAGRDLSRDESRQAFHRIMTEEVPDAVIGAFLGALAAKRAAVEEIVGAAEAMRHVGTKVRCDADCVDTCGTGGDGISTFNVSTTAAIIAAAGGAVVAKHGSRTNTRVSGSAEVLAALGVNVDADVPVVERCLAQVGIGFLFAPRLHPAMKRVVHIRKALGLSTVFNILGPLTNPAGARRQVLGVNRPDLTELMATVLRELGAVRAWVVHGLDGLCDLTVTAATRVTELNDGDLHTFEIRPGDAGLSPGRLDDLLVDSPSASAATVREILAGRPGACRDHALLNAAAALVVAGVAGDLRDGVARAGRAIDSGDAAQTLDNLARESRT